MGQLPVDTLCSPHKVRGGWAAQGRTTSPPDGQQKGSAEGEYVALGQF